MPQITTKRGARLVEKLRTLSLFAGIGGFDLGLERTGGFETVAFCEIDPAARKVLAKHWPGVPCYGDIRELSGLILAARGIAVDVIVGGFPCQDISNAGSGAGIADGTRSGLWAEFARLIGELRPDFVVVENVSALLSRGLDRVLGDLAAIGYDAGWSCIPASAVGAPHRRDRLWIVAHPTSSERDGNWPKPAGQPYRLANGGEDVAHSASIRLPRSGKLVQSEHPAPAQNGQEVEPVDGGLAGFWAVEPPVGRVANGVPGRVDRLKQLGNAVVPQVVELIGRAILAARDEERDAA